MVPAQRSRIGAALTAGAVFLSPLSAFADDASCIASHVEAQRQQKAGKTRSARDALVACANPSCPTVLVDECTSLLAEVEKSVPTIVLEARDAAGNDLGAVRVSIGGQELTARLDGKALEIDPGEHTFRFETDGFSALDQTVIVREGDKNRRIGVVFSTQLPSTPPSNPGGGRDISPAFWVSGSVGIAGLALFGGLGIAGLMKRGDLDDQGCAPTCASEEVDEVRGLFIGADVSLAIGIAGLALAPIFYFTSPVEPAVKASGLTLDFGFGGTTATIRGAF